MIGVESIEISLLVDSIAGQEAIDRFCIGGEKCLTRRVSSLPFEKRSNTKLKKIHCCSDSQQESLALTQAFHLSRSTTIFRLIIAPVILAARHCKKFCIDTSQC